MLRTPTPFPQVGSFALSVDTTLPVARQRAELVRIVQWASTSSGGRDDSDECFITRPLRHGASANTYVRKADLTDATPLTKAEERELTDVERELRGRARPNPTKATRLHALRERAIWSLVLNSELAKLHSLDAKKCAA